VVLTLKRGTVGPEIAYSSQTLQSTESNCAAVTRVNPVSCRRKIRGEFNGATAYFKQTAGALSYLLRDQ